jgi:hypothetical protein
MRDHTKLKVFELADEVALLVYRITAGFPKEGEHKRVKGNIKGSKLQISNIKFPILQID